MVTAEEDTGMITNDALLAKLEAMDDRVRETSVKIERLYHIICEGNGRPSMMVQVATMSDRLDDLEGTERESHVPRTVWIPLLLSSLIGAASLLVAIMALKH